MKWTFFLSFFAAKYVGKKRIKGRGTSALLCFVICDLQALPVSGPPPEKGPYSPSKCIHCQVSSPDQLFYICMLQARHGSLAGCGHHTGTDVTPGLCDLCCADDLLVSKQHTCPSTDGACRCTRVCVCVWVYIKPSLSRRSPWIQICKPVFLLFS